MVLAALVLLLAAQDPEARLKALEEQSKKQQEEIDRLKAAGPDVAVSLSEGLKVKSGDLDLHVGGRVQEHYRQVFDRPDSARTNPDTFLLRSARLQVDGSVAKDWGVMLQGDFASSTAGASMTPQAAWIEWRKYPELRIQAGQFKAPQSQEELASLLFTEFIERSPVARFVASYELGLMAHGKISDGLLGYQLSVANGRGHLENAGRGRNDDNDEKEWTARVTTSPFKGLRLGLWGSIADVDNVAMSTNFDLASSELAVTWLDATAGTLNGRRTRSGFELSFAWDSLCFRAEVLSRRDRAFNGATEATIPTQAWYLQISWIATGETKTPEARITPAGGCGAVEMAFRVAGATVGAEVQALGTSLTGQTRELSTATLGVNWWTARNVRISLDFIRETYGDPIDFGSGVVEDSLSGVLARFQVDF